MFEQKLEDWIKSHLAEPVNHRRRELLEKGLGYGTIEFLRCVWYPAIGNFNYLYPEWEVRDFNNGFRYLDLAYMPGGMKGGIEIQGYGSHARDLDVKRFKDLCMRHSLLALDGWIFLPVAFPSIKEEPKQCQQLILAFIGKFLSTDVSAELDWAEAESLRFARRLLRPFTPSELAAHLHLTDRHTRRILHRLVEKQIFIVAGGHQRYRTFQLKL
ncbi:transcriptional regulator [Paenibacillus thalictri]|uniref:Transcriptional regulator n=1 Tax=Paenibacillus thalictri TaxID=2527873 RepID=A0A4V2J4X6_9BACL|nr:transcriptional regulator [Paenibacillus thalictri]TBL81032.1 transcriptional regulator [Paenibacillus thalictri]